MLIKSKPWFNVAMLVVLVSALLATIVIPSAAAQDSAEEARGVEPIAVSDDDLDIGPVGYESNPQVELVDDGRPGEQRRITVWTRMFADTCESSVRLRVTTPAGAQEELAPFSSCDAADSLLIASIEVPADGQGTWTVEFDLAQVRGSRSASGYSVRALRLEPVSSSDSDDSAASASAVAKLDAVVDGQGVDADRASTSGGALGSGVLGPLPTFDLIEVYDADFGVDAAGFADNQTVTLADTGVDGARRVTIWIRTLENSCEGDIALRITAPHGGQLDSQPYSSCDRIGELLTITVDAPSYGAGEWTIEFDDVQDQNAGEEYSMRSARLDSVEGLEPADEFGRPPLLCDTAAIEPSAAGGDQLENVTELSSTEKSASVALPATAVFAPNQAYWFEYVSVTDQVMRVPGADVASGFDFEDQGAGESPIVQPLTGASADLINRNHSRLRADVVMTPVGDLADGGQWVEVRILAACVQSWSSQFDDSGAELKSIADDSSPSTRPDQAEDVSVDYAGSFQFERRADGSIGDIVHEADTDVAQLVFREGIVNVLPIHLAHAAAESDFDETDRTTSQRSRYAIGGDAAAPIVSKTAEVGELGLERRVDTTLDDAGGIAMVRAREELSVGSTAPAADSTDGTPVDHEGRVIPWSEPVLSDPAGTIDSPVDAFVLQTVNLGQLGTTSALPGAVEDAVAMRTAPDVVRNRLEPQVAAAQLAQIDQDKAGARFNEALELLATSEGAGVAAADQALPRVLRLFSAAVAADPQLVSDATSRVLGGAGSTYQSQVLVASLANAAHHDAHVGLASIISSESISPDVQLGAMVNALSISEPPVEVIDALVAKASSGGDIGASALMIAGGVAANSSDATLKASVESRLRSNLSSGANERMRSAAAIGLENLAGDKPTAVEARGAQKSGDCTQNTENCWIYNNCGGTNPYAFYQPCFDALAAHCVGIQAERPDGWPHCESNVWPPDPNQPTGPVVVDGCDSSSCWVNENCDGDPYNQGLECFDALDAICGQLAANDPNAGVPPEGWGYCNKVWPPPPGTGTGTVGYTPPEPGDLMWDLVLGPKFAQGHAWIGIVPQLGARLASVSAEAGLEFRVNGEKKPLLFAQAAMQVSQLDDNPDDNWNVGDMEIGQISRELQLTAVWRDDKFVDKPIEFPCGVGAQGGFEEGEEDGTSHTDTEDIDVPKAAAELFPEIIAAGPGAEASVPVLGVVSISLGVNVGIRVRGDWAWSVDFCNLGINGVLGTAAGHVKVAGSATVDAFAGVEVVLVEAGIGANITIFKVDAPIEASLTLINDQGKVGLQPCFRFTLNPTLLTAKVYAYARVFIKVPFLGKIVFWKWSGDLIDFNLGDELGIPGSIPLLKSECDPAAPVPPQIVYPSGESMSVTNGIISNPEITQSGNRRPVGVLASASAEDLLQSAGELCSFYGLGLPLTTPLKKAFGEVEGITNFFRWNGQGGDTEKTGGAEKAGGGGDGAWELTSISGATEQITTVVCDAGGAASNPDVSVTAFVAVDGPGRVADTPGVVLEHNKTYPVEFQVTNSSAEPLVVETVTLDGLLVSCDTAPIAPGETGSCITTFVASGNFGVGSGSGASIYDDLASDRMHTAVFQFASDGAPVAPATHYWYHALDPRSIEVSSYASIQIVPSTEEGAPGAYQNANVSPGPLVPDAGDKEVLIRINSTGSLTNLYVPPPFDVDCTDQDDDLIITCVGTVSLPQSDGQQNAYITARNGLKDDDGEWIEVDITTKWFFHLMEEPSLSVDTYAGGEIAVTSPGPNLQVANDPYHDLRFRISNRNATPLDSLVVSVDIEGDPGLPGETLSANYCSPVGSSRRTWECRLDSVYIPVDINQIINGYVDVQAVWGGASPSTTTTSRQFWLDNRVAGATATTDLIIEPAPGGPLIDVGEDSGTGTGTFVARGWLPSTAQTVDLNVSSGDIVWIDVDAAAGTWEAEVLAYPPNQPGAHFEFTSRLSASATLSSGEVVTQAVDFRVRPPDENDEIVFSNVIDLDKTPSTWITYLAAGELIVRGLTPDDVQIGDVIISHLDDPSNPAAIVDAELGVAALVLSVSPTFGGVQLEYEDTTLDSVYRQYPQRYSSIGAIDWLIEEIAGAPGAYVPSDDFYAHRSGSIGADYEITTKEVEYAKTLWGQPFLPALSVRLGGRVTFTADDLVADVNGNWTLPPVPVALGTAKHPWVPLGISFGAATKLGFSVDRESVLTLDGTYVADFVVRTDIRASGIGPAPSVRPVIEEFKPNEELTDITIDMQSADGNGEVVYEVFAGVNVSATAGIFKASIGPALPPNVMPWSNPLPMEGLSPGPLPPWTGASVKGGVFAKASMYAKFESVEANEVASGEEWSPGMSRLSANIDLHGGFDAGTAQIIYWTDLIDVKLPLLSIPLRTFAGDGSVSGTAMLINEIKNRTAVDGRFEYIELANGLGYPVEPDGWSIDVISRDIIELTTNEQSVNSFRVDGAGRADIAAGQLGEICISASGPIIGDPQCHGIAHIPGEALPVDGFVALFNEADTLVDVAELNDYGPDSGEFAPVADQTPGANDLSSNWCGSTVGYATGEFGTPGSANDPEGLCRPTAPDLVIVEVKGALATQDEREWIEIINTGSTALDLDLWQLRSGPLTARIRMAPGVAEIPVGDRAVICNAHAETGSAEHWTDRCDAYWGSRNETRTDQVWGNVDLATGQDIALWAGDRMVDEVPVLFTEPHRRSFAVGATSEDTVSNDVATNWCEQFVDAYVGSLATGDKGTPGEANADCAAATNDQLVISEYQQGVNDEAHSYEWIEVYNPGSSDVILDGWFLSDGVQDVALSSVTGPDGGFGLVEAGGYGVICADQSFDGSWTGAGGLCDATWDTSLVELAGRSEIWLTSASFTDAVDLGTPAVPGASSSTSTVTAAMVSASPPDATANDVASAWCTSLTPYHVDGASRVEYGTPGQANGSCHTAQDLLVSIVEVKRAFPTMFKGAWIELRNHSSMPVNPNGWLIADSAGNTAELQVAADARIAPGAVALLCAQANDFSQGSCFGTLEHVGGGLLGSGWDPALPGELQLASDLGHDGTSITVPTDVATLPATSERVSLIAVDSFDLPSNNDNFDSWCESPDLYVGEGNYAEFGSPGVLNGGCAAGAAYDWLVTEVKYRTATDGLVLWIEVHNFGPSLLPVNGFTVRVDGQEATVAGTAIDPGGYGILCLSDGHSANDLNSCAGTFSGIDFAAYSSVQLTSPDGSVDDVAPLAEVHGSTSDPWAGASSLILRPGRESVGSSANDGLADWCQSASSYATIQGRTEYGSPAAANAPCAATIDPEWLITEVQPGESAPGWEFQWIEIWRPDANSGAPLSLNGWTIDVDGEAVWIENAETLSIASHGVLCRAERIDGSPATLPYECSGTWSGPTIGVGSVITLAAPDGAMDTIVVADGVATGNAAQLNSRLRPFGRSVNDDPYNFCAIGTGTPGAVNVC